MEKEKFQELVTAAREADILSYFRESGYDVERKGENYYVKDYPGLCINPNKNQWYHHYTNVGRTNNSIDCLTLVMHKEFTQAVYELTGRDIQQYRSVSNERSKIQENEKRSQSEIQNDSEHKDKKNKELVMPDKAPNMRRMFAYFCQTRKIPSKIVSEFVHAGLLYQSQNTVDVTIKGVHQQISNANAVFVHKNNDGVTLGGEIQGCNSYKRFKGIAAGTGESAFKFYPVPSKDGKPKRAYIFESAIDLMSFYTFCNKDKIEGAMFISMAGLKPTVPKQLEAEGVKIISCVDNDDAGRKFEADNGFTRSDSVKHLLDDKGFKDWNELLVFKSENPNANLLENGKPNIKQETNNVTYEPRRR